MCSLEKTLASLHFPVSLSQVLLEVAGTKTCALGVPLLSPVMHYSFPMTVSSIWERVHCGEIIPWSCFGMDMSECEPQEMRSCLCSFSQFRY